MEGKGKGGGNTVPPEFELNTSQGNNTKILHKVSSRLKISKGENAFYSKGISTTTRRELYLRLICFLSQVQIVITHWLHYWSLQDSCHIKKHSKCTHNALKVFFNATEAPSLLSRMSQMTEGAQKSKKNGRGGVVEERGESEIPQGSGCGVVDAGQNERVPV